MPQKSRKRSPAEKVSFTISLFIVSVIFFLVCFTWITGNNNPPILSVTTDSSHIRYINQQYYVPFSVTNDGGKTVESVEIIAQLLFDDQSETGTQQVDFLSRQEKRSGEFVFSHDPQRGKLTIRVASYKLP